MECCREFQRLAAIEADGEASAGETLALAAHRRHCPACRAETERIAELKAAICSHAPLHGAPPELRARILAALPASPAPALEPQRRFATWWRLPLLGGFAVAVLLTSTLLLLPLGHTGEEQQLLDEIVSAHARSLQVAHLTDVPSSDRHTVKPWFGDKLDFSPPVSDHADSGFALVGGRLDIVNRRPVAAVVYRYRLHAINLFVWPATGAEHAPATVALRGYHAIRWTRGGMACWLVSDLNGDELQRLADLLRAD